MSALISTIAFLWTLASLVPSFGALASSGCLCTSDQPCWPSATVFLQLESRLSQSLVYPVPSAWACYPPSRPSGNCSDVIAHSGEAVWRSSRPGSMMMAQFETYLLPNGTLEACYLNTSITGVCNQGNVPVLGADVRSVEDIQTAISFAVEHGLKLVVKNTGHDWIGRSAGRGAFVVWTHNMKNISYNTAFAPQGGPENETFEAVTLGAGVQWTEAYEAVKKYGRMMVGGVAPTVGACGGWLSGGGHSLLSPSYGLGVDNALEISIVLSTGEYLITNQYQYSDLFWALRGGGPSTYGIVTSVTYHTYPAMPFQSWQYQGNITNSSVLPELFEGLLRYQLQFTDDGWGGYGDISNQSISFTIYAPNMTNETVATTTEGWRNFTESLAHYGVISYNQFTYSSWWDVISPYLFPTSDNCGGLDLMISSRMLSRNSIMNRTSEVVQVLLEYGSGFNMIAGGKVNKFDTNSAGLNPAWRDAIVELTFGILWDEETPMKDVRAMNDQLKRQIQALHDATPNDATYLNEAAPFEVEWQDAFFGTHYSMLKSIKNKYDPYRLFVVKEGVDSEDWNEDLTCR